MIDYSPFWETLKKKNITQYALIYKNNIPNGTLYRMRKGEHISTATIDSLCKILDCRVEDIIKYYPDQET